jgi:hypothetical protein
MTQRYSHLSDRSLEEATSRVPIGAGLPKREAEVLNGQCIPVRA